MTLIPLGQNSNRNTLGTAPPRPPLPDDGMSAEEYLRRAAEHQRQQEPRLRAWPGTTNRPERLHSAEMELDARMRDILRDPDGRMEVVDAATGETLHCEREPATVSLFGCDVVDLEADIVLTNVHALPQRQQSICPPSMPLHECVSEPMRQQMDTGRWPTVEEHLAGTSPPYEVFYDTWGHLTFALYTGRHGCQQQTNE